MKTQTFLWGWCSRGREVCCPLHGLVEVIDLDLETASREISIAIMRSMEAGEPGSRGMGEAVTRTRSLARRGVEAISLHSTLRGRNPRLKWKPNSVWFRWFIHCIPDKAERKLHLHCSVAFQFKQYFPCQSSVPFSSLSGSWWPCQGAVWALKASWDDQERRGGASSWHLSELPESACWTS